MERKLTPVQLAALTKGVRLDPESREALSPGTYPVDFAIRLQGIVTVGKDYERTPTVAVPLVRTLAVALKKAGFQRANIVRFVAEAMTEAIEAEMRGEEKMAEMEKVEAAMELVRETFSRLPKVAVKGPVKADVRLEPLPESVAASADLLLGLEEAS